MQQLSIINELIQQFIPKKTSKRRMVAAIVGGGNSAHILANLLPNHGVKTIVITRRPNEWNTDGITMFHEGNTYKGCTFIATNDYKHVGTADIIFLCCPINVQIELLWKIQPFIKSTALIGTVFGQARFDKMVEYVMGESQPCFAFIAIPWICRKQKYGESVYNAGDQDTYLAIHEMDNLLNMEWINYIHTDKTKTIIKVSFIKEMFYPSNIIIHPGICYGRYLVQSQNTYFYRNISSLEGAAMEQLDIERIKVINGLNKRFNVNINNISIIDMFNSLGFTGSNMCQCINNKPSLQNIIVDKDIHFNVQHRFFCDDIPFGLCYIKHFAMILNVETPFIDRVIRWAQSLMNIQFLDKNGKLVKENVPKYYVNQLDVY